MRVSVRDDDGLFFGLRSETIREIAGIGIILLGIFCAVSVIFVSIGLTEVGPVGLFIGDFLIMSFGNFMAMLFPLFLIAWGFNVIRRKRSVYFRQKFIAANLMIISLCVLLALPFAGNPETNSLAFMMGGIMGSFFLQEQGLGLLSLIGVVGCSLLFGWVLIVGLMITFNFLFYDMSRAMVAKVKAGKFTVPLKWPSFSFRMPSMPEFSLRWLVYGRGDIDREFDEEEAENRYSNEATITMEADEAEEYPISGSGSPNPQVENIQLPLPAPAPTEPYPGNGGLVQQPMIEQKESPSFANFKLPPIAIFADAENMHESMTKEEIRGISDLLESTLADHNISAQVVNVTQGPVVTRFELQPAPGVKINRILNLDKDLAMVLRAENVRIVAPIPGKAAVGLEVPNPKREFVTLKSLLRCNEFKNHSSSLALCLGKGIDGKPVIADLAAMPHLLIAGATGSGKSVCMSTLICSILFRMSPAKVRFLMIDPKRVEFNDYQQIPHLLAPVVHQPKKAAASLEWAVEQMEWRYERLVDIGARNIDSYNRSVEDGVTKGKKIKNHQYMPHIVILIDELADLMLVAKNEVEESIQRLAQLSRAVGIHLVLATQRPSVNVITGIIKANFPTRIAFQVSSKVDSRTILDTNGAETLLGKGDMLFSAAGATKPIRIQGAFVSDKEVLSLTNHLRKQSEAQYEMLEFETAEERALKAKMEVERMAKQSKIAALGGKDSLAAQFELNQPIDKGSDGAAHSEIPQKTNGKSVKSDQGSAASKSETVAAEAAPQVPVSSPPLKAEDFMVTDSDVDEDLLRGAIKLILENNKASVSLIQRRMKVGFARAGRLMDAMEERGIVGPYQGSKPRQILVEPQEFLHRMAEANL